MFTGIIEEMGNIKEIEKKEDRFTLAIEANATLENARVGDSIAINGVCLTITHLADKFFSVDVMPETINATNIGEFREDTPVNLERSLSANDRLGGHFVSGHVDGTGEILRKHHEKNAVAFTIRTSKQIIHYFVMKGSVAIDGISLTVFGVTEDTLTVSIIPHTLEVTTMGKRQEGDRVNIECDLIGKYIEKFVSHRLDQDGPGNLLDIQTKTHTRLRSGNE